MFHEYAFSLLWHALGVSLYAPNAGPTPSYPCRQMHCQFTKRWHALFNANINYTINTRHLIRCVTYSAVWWHGHRPKIKVMTIQEISALIDDDDAGRNRDDIVLLLYAWILIYRDRAKRQLFSEMNKIPTMGGANLYLPCRYTYFITPWCICYLI